MPTDQLVELGKLAIALEAKSMLAGPKTDDELHEYVKKTFRVPPPPAS